MRNAAKDRATKLKKARGKWQMKQLNIGHTQSATEAAARLYQRGACVCVC